VSLDRAFTLIELLVVVTIIVILLALLTPALDKTIQKTELTICAARQHGLLTIFNGYAAEQKRKFPPGTRDADAYEHTPWVSSRFVKTVEASSGNNKSPNVAGSVWGVVPEMLVDSSYKDFGYHNSTGWVIGYNYLGGHPMLDKANTNQPGTKKPWHSPIGLAYQGTGDMVTCWNAWSNGTTSVDRSIGVGALQWSIAAHLQDGGPLGSFVPEGAYFNYAGPGVGGDTKPLGSSGANIGFSDGHVSWRTIEDTEVYIDAADPAGSPDAAYIARW
jgi:prepilin-type N-terminal cleavage/methylation domain-containing protein/prepilin-type processing-associated H-X9-DG protein